MYRKGGTKGPSGFLKASSSKSEAKRETRSSSKAAAKKEKEQEEVEVKYSFVRHGVGSSPYASMHTGVYGYALAADAKSKGNPMGRCDATWINRDAFRHHFQVELMNQGDYSSDPLQVEVFDRWGFLRTRHYQDENMKGSGVWDETLGEGPFLIVTKLFETEELQNLPTMQRRDVLKRLVEGTIAFAATDTKLGTNCVFYRMITKPQSLLSAKDRENECKRTNERENLKLRHQLFQEIGFRRIGLTNQFCMAIDPGHPSLSLPIEPFNEDIFNAFWDRLTAPKAFPQNLPFRMKYMGPLDKESVIRYLKGEDPENKLPENFDFLAQDEEGNTYLHLAACRYPSVIRLLIEKAPEALEIRNRRGERPWEVFLDNMFQNVIDSEKLRQVYPRLRRCGVELAKGMGLPKEKVDGVMAQYRYGCDCGECLNGLVSRRGIYDVGVGAELAGKEIRTAVEAVADTDSPSVFKKMIQLNFLPVALRMRPVASKEFFLEYARIMEEFAPICYSGRLPTEEDARRISPGYFKKGGQLKYVYSAIVVRTQMFITWIIRPSTPQYTPDGEMVKRGPEPDVLELYEKRLEARKQLPRCGICDNDVLRLRLRLFGFDPWGTVRNISLMGFAI